MATNFTEFINSLASQTGLSANVIAAWVSREQGVHNNVLGVTSASAKTASNPAGLLSFSSQTAGATATANLLKSSSMYSGIISSASGTQQQQAMAISQSPWHLGGSGLKAAGGTDPYYFAGFVKAGILSGTPSAPGGGTASTSKTLTSGLLSGLTGAGSGNPGLNPNPTAGLPNASNVLGVDLTSPLYTIGVLLIAAVLILVGGIIILKPKMPSALPI